METGGRIGKYELEEFLGGGMSHVFRARDTVLGRTVAVKILTEAGCAQSDTKARFLAEARMASNLTHDNVLSIYDFGEDDRHRPFIVMEFLRGRDLRSAIRTAETGDSANKVRIALQVARAIQYIHSRKIIHRDVKPENIHIATGGVAKLMDFGIAKTEGLSMTRTGFVLGTPYYMAPEQVTGKDVTEQVDVYAFGVLLFELMTGVKPIAGDTVERIFYIILNEPLDLSPLKASGAPPAICDLVARCIAKNPAERPQGFAPVCAVLEQLAGGSAAAAAPVPDPVAEAPPPRPPTRWAVWGSVAALLILLGSAFALAWSGYRHFDAQARSAADAISAVGIAPDGLVNPEALRQFEILREQLDTIDRYHRQGAPLGYRLGAMLWGDLYGSVRRLYFERFRAFFLGPAQNNELQFLRGLPDTPGPAYGVTYDTLKAYLSTTAQPDKSEPDFLVPVMLRWWGSGLNPGPDRETAARREFEFYAQELAQDDPFPRGSDTEAVTKARHYLSQFAGVERAYAFVMDDAAKHNPPLGFNRQFAGSERVLAESYEVPGQYTKAGWDFVKETVAHGDRYFAGEAWVVGDNASAGADRPHLAQDLAARYRADFANAWRDYLQSAALVRFDSVKDAAQKLADLAGEKSPLVEWLDLAARNTAVGDAAITGVFQPVEAAVAAGPRYRESLAALGAALPKGGAPADAAVAAAAQTARQIEASFHAYAEGRVDVQVSRMLDEPIAAAKQVLRAGGPAEWNARGADLCTQMKPVLSKYPFATGAVAQASAAEVASLFRPNEGIVWKSYASSLQKLILRKGPRFIASASAGLPVNPAFLAFLDHAAAFSDGAFAGGATQPKIRYTLRPVITPEVDSVKLTIDGQSATFRGNAMAKPFVWSGTGQEMRVSVKFKSKGEFNWSRSATPWSVFLFFDGGGRRQGAQIEIPLRGQTPGSLWFEVTATPPVFDRGYFAGLSCVADIVR